MSWGIHSNGWEVCICANGGILIDGRCVCPKGMIIQNGICVCPPGSMRRGDDECVCNTEGAVVSNGKCECIAKGLPLEGCEYKNIGNRCGYSEKKINKTVGKLYLLICVCVGIITVLILLRVLKASK